MITEEKLDELRQAVQEDAKLGEVICDYIDKSNALGVVQDKEEYLQRVPEQFRPALSVHLDFTAALLDLGRVWREKRAQMPWNAQERIAQKLEELARVVREDEEIGSILAWYMDHVNTGENPKHARAAALALASSESVEEQAISLIDVADILRLMKKRGALDKREV